MRYLVLGAGLQGRAAAFDLLRSDPACGVTLADHEPAAFGAHTANRTPATPSSVARCAPSFS